MRNHIFQNYVQHSSLKLCDDLTAVASRTWTLLRNDQMFDFGIGEETIIDINLLELQIRQPDLITTQKLSRQRERAIGAYWIWGFVGASGRTLMLYVQAKKLFHQTQRYNSLINRFDPFHQVDRLLQNKFVDPVTRIRHYPIYVFYNHLTQNHPLICNCGQQVPLSHSGCSYADALDVPEKIERNQDSLSDLLEIQFPWSCLVCCGNNGSGDMVDNIFERLVSAEKVDRVLRTFNIQDFNPESLLYQSPPDLVTNILSGRGVEGEAFLEAGIGYITIFKQAQ